jgi:aminocarboxymuconate-semialdehyde decarboxylase
VPADRAAIRSPVPRSTSWEAAADLSAVIFIHPWGCSLGPRLSSNYLGNTFGQPAETALALSRLIFDGTLDRYPALKLLAAHGGGFLPTYIGRSDHAWENRSDARGCARRPSEYLRRIWYDALVYTPQALRHLVDAAGAVAVIPGRSPGPAARSPGWMSGRPPWR